MELEARAPAEGCRVADQVTLGSTASNTISAAFTGRVLQNQLLVHEALDGAPTKVTKIRPAEMADYLLKNALE
ncbi:MAG: hypothetical protein FJX35_15050 [Alphaproteobacteria bacterium]|nr:hypothetical protein [Alphaproteobacteria bacterium]